MAYGDFKGFPRRIASGKISREKALHIARNPKYHGYQRSLPSMVYKSLIKKLGVVLLKVKLCQTKK